MYVFLYLPHLYQANWQSQYNCKFKIYPILPFFTVDREVYSLGGWMEEVFTVLIFEAQLAFYLTIMIWPFLMSLFCSGLLAYPCKELCHKQRERNSTRANPKDSLCMLAPHYFVFDYISFNMRDLFWKTLSEMYWVLVFVHLKFRKIFGASLYNKLSP